MEIKEKIKIISEVSKKINEKLDNKNEEFKMRLEKERGEEQEILRRIKYKLKNPVIYRLYVKNLMDIQNIIDDFKGIKVVGGSKNKLKKIEEELDEKIEKANLEFEKFIEKFQSECLKSKFLSMDAELLTSKVIELYLRGKI